MTLNSSSRTQARAKLLEKTKELTTSPGVYLMKNEHGIVLYVGKAKSLKNRVSSYFQPIQHEHPRTELLLTQVHDFEIIITETEKEALILECSLIKKHKPKFNVRLKDDKQYPYIKIPSTHPFPRLQWVRKVEKDGAQYFGPFPSSHAARVVLKLLNEKFKLRDCSENTFLHRSRPCILYQMGYCCAPCVGKVTEEEYRELLNEAVLVLQGHGEGLIQELTLEMQEMAEREQFEVAARIRDQIQSIQIVAQTQSVSQEMAPIDQDVYAIERNDTQAHGVVLNIQSGKLLAVKHFVFEHVESSLQDSEIFYDFLTQSEFQGAKSPSQNSAQNSTETRKRILVKELPQEVELLEEAFQVKIYTPQTDAEKQLVTVAHLNAKYALSHQKQTSGSHGLLALEEVQKKLGLDQLPRRIECYDISNTQGEDSVASRVVFMDGAPEKNLYRKYKIKTVRGADDFASMREVLMRRFSKMNTREGDEQPDLVVIDGGKGQLAQVMAVFEDLNIQGVGLVGLAKARTEKNFQSTEVKSSMERVFVPNRVNPVLLYPHTKTFKLLTHLRDEAHRFAIQFHRSLRDKIR